MEVRTTKSLVKAGLLAIALVGCVSSGGNEGSDDASVLPTPTVSFDVRGVVSEEIPEGRPDRFLIEVGGEDPFDLGDDAIVVFHASMLRCASGDDVAGSPARGDEVWLQAVGGISESDPPILHPDTVVLDC